MTAAASVIDNIATLLAKKQFCAALFIDLSWEFDGVNHKILLPVIADSTQSAHLTIRNSLPPGSIPVLFFINSIILPNQYFNVHYFTDDSNIYAFLDPPQLRPWPVSSLPLILCSHHSLVTNLCRKKTKQIALFSSPPPAILMIWLPHHQLEPLCPFLIHKNSYESGLTAN